MEYIGRGVLATRFRGYDGFWGSSALRYILIVIARSTCDEAIQLFPRGPGLLGFSQ